MKKYVLLAAATAVVLSASAQAVEEQPFFNNWSIGVNGGVTTPMSHNPFFKSMRPVVGLTLDKQITPTFAVGVESLFGINTSNWKGRIHSSTAFDNSYVGVYGRVDLFNLFGGYNCGTRPFTIQAKAGAGWGHDYIHNVIGDVEIGDWNYFATKVGLEFDFNVSDNLTVGIEPSVLWNMTGGDTYGTDWEQTSAGYSINNATFNITAGIRYRFGDGFECVRPYNQSEVDALNNQVNDLRAALASSDANVGALQAKTAGLEAQLDSCRNRKPQVVKEVSNNLNSVRYVFFRIGSAVITADQQPNIEMIADYLKNHPQAKVVVKGYASPDGNYDFNIKLAAKRAESVKNSLVKRYKIAASRIEASGQGIGEMFSEPSWNRVSICTIEESK